MQASSVMNKIIAYEHRNFEGLSREFTSDVPDLSDRSFNDCISSLKVIGNPWVAYTGANFSEEPTVFEEGEYANVYYNDWISSLQLVTEDLENPQITLYEEENYQGRSLVLNCETSLFYGPFNDTTSSHKVQRGAWVLYQHKDRGGYIRVAREGRDVPKYDWFDNRLTHIRPLKAGKPSIKAEFEWDKKKETAKSVIFDTMSISNYGSENQIFPINKTREYSGTVTESFQFSNSTQIALGTKFEVSMVDFKKEFTFNVTDTFTVEKGNINTRSTTERISVSFPNCIPPRTKLTVNILRKELTMKVPVKLTITRGFNTKVEYGEYHCENGSSIGAEIKEEKI